MISSDRRGLSTFETGKERGANAIRRQGVWIPRNPEMKRIGNHPPFAPQKRLRKRSGTRLRYH
jgi:hypothetical protein